jgi:SAM-dependent methyltransferase
LNKLWKDGPLARLVMETEAAMLAAVLDDVFGFELLQVGTWGPARALLAHSRTRHQRVAARDADVGVNLVCQFGQLPVASNSVDAVLLPHTLEVVLDPHAVLREVDRVLAAEGQVLVLGFNPRSPWGWRAAASRAGFPPGTQHLLPESRLRDWLGLLGYEISAAQRYLYCWPMGAQGTATIPSLRRGWYYPWPAGAYLLRARKRVFGVTPMRARRRGRQALLGGALEPSA